MVGRQITTRKHATINFRWNANRASVFRRAVVEDVSEENDCVHGDRCTDSADVATGRQAEELGHDLNIQDACRLEQSMPATDPLELADDISVARPAFGASGTNLDTECCDAASKRCARRNLGPWRYNTKGGTNADGSMVACGNHEPDSGLVSHGHSYDDVHVSDSARMHAGDVFNISNATFQGSAGVTGRCQQSSTLSNSQTVTIRLASCAILIAFLGTMEQLFLLMQAIVRQHVVGPQLLTEITHKIATFEDALGKEVCIDVDFVGDWESFKFLLARAFTDKPGSQRIANAGYRLFRRGSRGDVYHPRHLPPFAEVFRHGEYVQMSIHFGWDEVSDEQCPRCGLKSGHYTDAEMLCARCNFRYRSRVRDVDKLSTSRDYNGLQQTNVDQTPAHGPARDVPGHFHRISISARDVIYFTIDRSTEVHYFNEPLLATPPFNPSASEDRVERWLDELPQPILPVGFLTPLSLDIKDVDGGHIRRTGARSM